ncbi:unnamed protein product [Prorocentrum cordatum]|uniref:Reverse transcriptase domain-containing protein n=1 Tax=Prorocentrum cordatum TaxID=2364126 RepID=A0ABN9YDP8_9DINO|nr:unnamed protein product [Polarella glacialis]
MALRPEFATADPTIIMSENAKEWESIWTDPVDERKHTIEQLECARRRALMGDLDPIDMDMLNDALRATSASKAKGLDQLSPTDIDRLPTVAKAEQLDIIAECKRHLAWPRQISATKCAIVPKPVPARGDRVLGMLPLPVKLWSRARGDVCSMWSAGLSDHWDTAVKSSSALRAGLLRAVLDEAGIEIGASAMTLLLDIEKFYDTVSLVI